MSTSAPAEPPLEIIIREHHGHAWNKTDISAGVGLAVVASRQVLRGPIHQLGGWSIRETTAAAGAAFRLHDGQDANGEVLCNCNLAANESVRDTYGPHGIRVATGHLWLEWLSGSIEGVVYWR